VAYIGDVNGRMWRLDLSADATSTPKKGELVAGQIQGWSPFLLYDASTATTQPNQPIYLEPSAIFINGGPRPTLGIAFGTGDRSNLLKVPNPSVNRFFYVVDTGQTTTLHEADLRNLTPAGGVTAVGSPGPGPLGNGFFLDFASRNEKTVSTVFSTQGFLSLLTFTPDSDNPCATEGRSFRYRFFFLNGQGGYNLVTPTGTYADYRTDAGTGVASAAQLTSVDNIIDITVSSSTSGSGVSTAGPGWTETVTPVQKRTINQNWKEQ
jgi:Tfp pilus tip-associated adhesin PilY1